MSLWRILLPLAIITQTSVVAQEISNINPVIRIIAGEPFYVHEVLEGQSLEAIAEAYCSNVAAIHAENPSLTDPLITRINIRIPYSDASAARMMDIASKTGNGEVNDREGKVEQPWSEQPISDEERTMLQALSLTVSESVSYLEKAKEEIEAKAYLDEDGFPKKATVFTDQSKEMTESGTTLGDVLSGMCDTFINGSSQRLEMKEYFLVRVNPRGVITNVKDERTETNENTHLINPDSLRGRMLADSTNAFDLRIVPIGLNLQLQRFYYPVKVSKGKLKALRTGSKEAALKADHPHFKAIAANDSVMGLTGKYRIELVEGSYHLSIHDQFEYNPFGLTLNKLYRTEVLEVRSVSKRRP